MATTLTHCCTPVWVGRQPIVDADKQILAYEVLYRSAAVGHANIGDGNQATSAVLLNMFVDIGLEQVADDRVAFINLTREFLIGEYPLPECPERLVLEILEDVKIDDALIESVKKLRRAGYRVALDDVVYRPGLEPLLELASVVKVDLPKIPQDEWPQHVEALRRWPVKLLAEKVETQEEFEICRDLGFDLFQGYFLSKPELVEGRKLDGNQLALLRILAEVNSPETDIEALTKTVEQDPALCVKLLKYVNSSHMGLRRTVESLKHACVLMGLQNLRTITTLLLLAGNKNLPQHAARAALLRGWMCRNLVREPEPVDPHALFTVGLLSLLDVLMGQPLASLLAELPLEENVRAAILERSGPAGRVLETVIQYESCDWDRLTRIGADTNLLRSAYLQAVAEVKAAWELA